MVVGEPLAHEDAPLGAEVLEGLAGGGQEGEGELHFLALGTGVDAHGGEGAADNGEILEKKRDYAFAVLLDEFRGTDLLLLTVHSGN